MGDVYSSKFTAPAGSNSVTFSVDYPQNSGTQDLSITKPGGQEIKQEDFAANGITLLTNQNTSTSLNCLIGDPNSTTLLPAGDHTVKLYSTNYQFPDQKVSIASILNDGNGQAKITLATPAAGIKPGDTVTIAGNSLAAYNTDHIVQSLGSDSLTLVTDQLYVGQGAGGTASGWQQPQFTGSFSSLAPQVSLRSIPAIPNSPILNVPLSGSVSPAFAQATAVDLYLDTDNSGRVNGLFALTRNTTQPTGTGIVSRIDQTVRCAKGRRRAASAKGRTTNANKVWLNLT